MLYNPSETIKNIRRKLKKYLKDNKLESIVIGISGGIDSAVVAALAYPVCRELDIPIIGRYLEIYGNKKDEKSRAIMVGLSFCDDFKSINLNKEFRALKHICKKEKNPFKKKVREGNIKARIRMIYLYDLAQANGGLVMGTDNLTEELEGFWTIHGDHFDLGIIQKLWKTEVYQISEELEDAYALTSTEYALRKCREATPTDGLGITDSDLDQIKADSYEEVDMILQEYLSMDKQPQVRKIFQKKWENHPVIKRHLATGFKRNWPVVISRKDIV